MSEKEVSLLSKNIKVSENNKGSKEAGPKLKWGEQLSFASKTLQRINSSTDFNSGSIRFEGLKDDNHVSFSDAKVLLSAAERHQIKDTLAHLKNTPGLTLTVKEASKLSRNVRFSNTPKELSNKKLTGSMQEVNSDQRTRNKVQRGRPLTLASRNFSSINQSKGQDFQKIFYHGLRNESQLSLADAQILLGAAVGHQVEVEFKARSASHAPKPPGIEDLALATLSPEADNDAKVSSEQALLDATALDQVDAGVKPPKPPEGEHLALATSSSEKVSDIKTSSTDDVEDWPNYEAPKNPVEEAARLAKIEEDRLIEEAAISESMKDPLLPTRVVGDKPVKKSKWAMIQRSFAVAFGFGKR